MFFVLAWDAVLPVAKTPHFKHSVQNDLITILNIIWPKLLSFTSDRCFKVTSLNLSYCCTRIVKWGFEVWKIKQNSLAVTEYYKCSYCLNNNYKSLNNCFEKNSHVRIQSTVVSHSSDSINSCLSQFGFHQQLSLTVRIPSTVVSHT